MIASGSRSNTEKYLILEGTNNDLAIVTAFKNLKTMTLLLESEKTLGLSLATINRVIGSNIHMTRFV